jgi:membrane fusion protein (multidrug efflux system)
MTTSLPPTPTRGDDPLSGPGIHGTGAGGPAVPHGHGVGHAATEEAPTPRPLSARRIASAVVAAAAIFVVAFVVGTLPRVKTARALATIARQDATPTVQVTRIKRGLPRANLDLPGTLQPIHQAAIYARTSGYVKNWNVDIGRTVRAGDVLAVIETPDLDEQLAQSKANLEQAKSGLDLARVEQQRWAAMVKDSVVTVDEYDQKVQIARAAAAAVGADEADVRRLEALQSFEHVTAPFSGIVTSRNVDVGAFVQAGGGMIGALPSNGSTAPTSLFQMAETDTVRVYVTVPQTNATSIAPGQVADVRVTEFPGQIFTGRVVRTARAVDPQSRTLLTEIQILNPKRVLLPGMYAEIQFAFNRANPPLIVPATALLPLTDGMKVLEVDSDHRVHHRTIKIGRDYGSYVEADSGVTEGATLVLNPNDALIDGMEVRLEAQPTPSDSERRAPRPVQVPARAS